MAASATPENYTSLTDVTCLEGGGERLERGARRQVGEVVLVLARGATLAHQPDLLLTRKVRVRAVPGARRRPIRDPHPQGCKGRLQRSFGAAAPGDRAPRLPREHVLGGQGPEVRDGSLARTPARRHRPGEPDLGRIDLLGARDPDRPRQTTR